MKLVLFRRPIDKNLTGKTLNFLPYCPHDDYIIEGTQIIPHNGETEKDYIILENFQDNNTSKTKPEAHLTDF